MLPGIIDFTGQLMMLRKVLQFLESPTSSAEAACCLLKLVLTHMDDIFGTPEQFAKMDPIGVITTVINIGLNIRDSLIIRITFLTFEIHYKEMRPM